MTVTKPLEEQHRLHERRGGIRPGCPLCLRNYWRHLLSIPRRPEVAYSYETVYQLAPGEVVIDERWHPHIIASVERQPGGDYGVQYVVFFEDGERHVYQLQELIHFLCGGDRDHVLDVYAAAGKQDTLVDHAALARHYDEAERADVRQTHLERYQQRLDRSTVESDRAYYRTYLETFDAQP